MKPFLHITPREVVGLDFRATLVSLRIPKIGELWILTIYGDVGTGLAAKEQLRKAWEHVKDREFWVILGDFNLEAYEVREWMSIAAPGSLTLDVGSTCYGGEGSKPSTIDFGFFSKSARFLVHGATACLAAIPTHRPVDYKISVNGLDAEVWSRPKVTSTPTEAVFGPQCCDHDRIKAIEEVVRGIEDRHPGQRIIKGRSESLEEELDKAWADRVAAIDDEICGNTGHRNKVNKEGAEVMMGQPTVFRKTSLRQHLSKQAAQNTRDFVFWEFLYRRFSEARAWCTKGSLETKTSHWTRKHWVPWYKKVKRRGSIAVKDRVISQEDWDNIVQAAWCEHWRTKGEEVYCVLADQAKACMEATRKVADKVSQTGWEAKIKEGFKKGNKFGHSITKPLPATSTAEVPTKEAGTTTAVDQVINHYAGEWGGWWSATRRGPK